MLERLARAITRRPKTFLLGIIGFVMLAGPIGGSVANKLVMGGFENPAAESSLARDALSREFKVDNPNLVLLVTTSGKVHDAATKQDGVELTQRLTETKGISQIKSYWTSTGEQEQLALQSNDAKQALILGRIGGTESEAVKRVEELRESLAGQQGSLTVKLSGTAAVGYDTDHTIQEDIKKFEAISFPALFLLLVLVFGSVVSAFLPLIMVLPVVVGTMFMLRMIAVFTDVSVFAMSTAIVIGLGLAIDYSLFIVSRYREELAASGGDVNDKHARAEAVVAAVRSAGRTVMFSAVTVMISVSALTFFPLLFLRSIGFAGIGVTFFAAIASIIVMPTLLVLFGSKINSLDLRKGILRIFGRKQRVRSVESGLWHRLATFVMRRAVPVAALVTIGLLILGAPFLGAKYSLPDDRQLPTASESRQVGDTLRKNFDSRASDAMTVVTQGLGDRREKGAEISAYAAALSNIDAVGAVVSSEGVYLQGERLAAPDATMKEMASPTSAYFSVLPMVDPFAPEGEKLVEQVRSTNAPWDTKVAGNGPGLVDTKKTLGDLLPRVLLFMAISTFILLFLFTGSVILPIKALILNVLSLSATFGAMVWIFQDGHFAGSLDATVTGSIVAIAPILMFALMFGLSMDYEVFMLSRIKEEYERTGDNTGSVARGLELSGRLITAAALLFSVVTIGQLITTNITFQKMFALGLTLALFVDAVIVRGLLLPATMKLLGRANWWAPAPLRRLHRKIGFAEEPPPRPEPVPVFHDERAPLSAGR